jgi:geranylgeranyl diphosphate synthase type II
VDIKQYLRDRAKCIDEALLSLLPSKEEFPTSLHRAIHHSVFAGGKRIRPILLLAASELAGGARGKAAAMNTAAAYECIHTYSLIHDDLPALDNDDLRRGKPSCHKAFGEATAILAGDALLTIAFELIAATPPEVLANDRDKILLRVTRELALGAGSTGMIGGQVVDLESEGKDLDIPMLEHIHTRKTGALIVAAIRGGAMIGGATDTELDLLTRYGKAVGLAFQIADDILDVEATNIEMGKTTGSDERHGKATYPSVMGLRQSKEMAQELVDIAITAIDSFDERAEPLRAIAGYIVERKN